MGAPDVPPAARRRAMAGGDGYVIVGRQSGAPHEPNAPNDS